MTKQDIINYVRETLCNTNPSVIGNMVDQVTRSSGSHETYVIPITLDMENQTISLGVTYSQIKAQYDAGKTILAEDTSLTTSYKVYARLDEGKFYCEGCFGTGSNKGYIGYFSINAVDFASGFAAYTQPK